MTSRRRGALGGALVALVVGACASPAPADAPPAPIPPLAIDVVARALAVVKSCSPLPGMGALATGARDDDLWLRRFAEAIPCLSSHGGGCAALSACVGLTVDVGVDCPPECAGTVATFCGEEGEKIRTDCGVLGGVCAIHGETAECVAPPAGASATCSDDGHPCVQGTWFRYGSQCPGGVACASRLAGSTCSAAGCRLGAVCDIGGLAVDGVACSGKSLNVCVAGSVQRVDCTTLGFTGCDNFSRACTPNPLFLP